MRLYVDNSFGRDALKTFGFQGKFLIDLIDLIPACAKRSAAGRSNQIPTSNIQVKNYFNLSI